MIELGANVGLSGAYLAAAIPNGGRLTTVGQSGDRQALARQLFESVGLADRIEVVTGTFRTVAERVASPGFDVAFVDGDYTFAETCWLVESLLCYARPGSVIVVDDINHCSEMRRAWRLIVSGLDVASVFLGDSGSSRFRIRCEGGRHERYRCRAKHQPDRQSQKLRGSPRHLGVGPSLAWPERPIREVCGCV